MISIIIPVYNAEKYLKTCIDSVLGQSFRDFEIILVDDGSKDKSGELCDGFACLDARVRVIHKANGGVSSARNTGIDAAAGQYIGFIDADDWVEPTYLERLLQNMSSGGFSIAGIVRDSAAPVKESSVNELTRAEAQISVLSAKGIRGWSFSRLFDGETIKNNKIYFDLETSQCEDELFCIHYLHYAGGKILVSNEAGYHYRSNPEGALRGRYCKTNADPRNFSEILAIEKMEPLIEKDSAVIDAWRLRLAKAACATLRTMISCHYSDKKEMQRLEKMVRQSCLPYLFGETGAASSKISMLLSSISPRLEWMVYRRTRTLK